MFNNLFKPQSLLPDEAIDWLFNGFAWALQNYGSDVFYNETILVKPTRECFPGKGDSIEEMAELILDHVKNYAGLAYVPTRIVDHHEFEGSPWALANMQQVLEEIKEVDRTALTLLYEPQQVGNPNAMVANYAHALAYHLGSVAQTPAPCDQEQWPHMMELLAVYMGFGIMFVNTARPKVSVGCGSCGNPAMERKGALDEIEVLYALAIFCVLKDIPTKQVVPHIKSYLKPLFKKAFKDVARRSDALGRLKAIDSASQLRGQDVTPQLSNL